MKGSKWLHYKGHDRVEEFTGGLKPEGREPGLSITHPKLQVLCYRRPQSEDEFESTILPGQFRYFAHKDWQAKTWEEKLAYGFLERLLLDLVGVHDGVSVSSKIGNKERKIAWRRLRSVAETWLWMKNDARRARFLAGPDGFGYDFETWCEGLDIHPDYMRRYLPRLLVKVTKEVKTAANWTPRKEWRKVDNLRKRELRRDSHRVRQQEQESENRPGDSDVDFGKIDQSCGGGENRC